MNAYSQLYLNDAMCTLGEMLDYAVNDCRYELEQFFEWFAFSAVGALFESGDPKYVTGMSGVELAREVVELTGSESPIIFKPLPHDDPKQRKPEISLAKQELGWEPRIQLKEGLGYIIEYFKEYLKSHTV